MKPETDETNRCPQCGKCEVGELSFDPNAYPMRWRLRCLKCGAEWVEEGE